MCALLRGPLSPSIPRSGGDPSAEAPRHPLALLHIAVLCGRLRLPASLSLPRPQGCGGLVVAHRAKAQARQHGAERSLRVVLRWGLAFRPIWDHNLEYWRESLRRSEKVLFLKYEEMNVRRVAEYVGRPFSEEEEKDGVVEEIVQLCSFEKLSSMEVNKRGVYEVRETSVPHESFFRKGKVGDWANHLSREMGETLDRIVQEKLAGSGLTFQAS
ncbi:flavonol 3-sulfotransferase-like [Phoenix dactylifera]|uniref:Sulfotransferase n=1 Tax=Phoenix dactylifera TaxID=42345 RepID=A0A8B9APZ9_PHODC|nr:flavonol 3-sulfotransferase-like [Phoenix dactylifera]